MVHPLQLPNNVARECHFMSNIRSHYGEHGHGLKLGLHHLIGLQIKEFPMIKTYKMGQFVGYDNETNTIPLVLN